MNSSKPIVSSRGRLKFQVDANSSECSARATSFTTLHSQKVQTPLFMPVGTHSLVRHVRFQDLRDTGAEILLSNTYHLHLKPGAEFFRKIGGLHKFTGWERSFLTDSGGFQIFCMPDSRKITEEGATFRSYINGDLIHLSPEESIATQKAIGSDIMMVLDECVPSTVDKPTAQRAMELTHRWAQRSLNARGNSAQSIFGIVQGACFKDLRLESAKTLSQMNFDGLAIGGLAVGESKAEREEHTQYCTDILPKDLPRYLMGVGTPIDLLEAVRRGVDMFDCIIPTAHAEQGVAYTFDGKIKLRRAVYREDDRPIDPNCNCSTCQNYSRGYLHHLLKSHEPSAASLIAIHNLHFYKKLTESFREAILKDRFMELYKNLAPRLVQDDPEYPPLIPVKKKKKDHSTLNGYSVVLEDGTARICPPDADTLSPASAPSAIGSAISQFFETSPKRKAWQIQELETGYGSSLMSLLHAMESYLEEHPETQFQVTTQSESLSALELACKNPGPFPHIRHSLPAGLVKDSKWRDNSDHISVQHYVTESNAKNADSSNDRTHATAHLCIWTPFEKPAEEIAKHFLDSPSPETTFLLTDLNQDSGLNLKAQLLLAGCHLYDWKSSESGMCFATKDTSMQLEKIAIPLDASFLKRLCDAMERDASLRENFGESTVWNKLSSHPQLVARPH